MAMLQNVLNEWFQYFCAHGKQLLLYQDPLEVVPKVVDVQK